MRHALAIKSETDQMLVLEGWAAVFSGPDDPDLTGDYFTKSTDFWIGADRLGSSRPVIYDHGFDTSLKRAVIGACTIEAKSADDVEGLWLTAQIDKSTTYIKQIRALAEAGLLGSSTGAISHLVEREAKSTDANWLKTWPIGELSLTVTPAEPRTIGIAEVRSLVEDFESATTKRKAAAASLKALSFEEMQEQLRAAVNRVSDDGGYDADWSCLIATYPDAVVVDRTDYDQDGDGGLWRFPYTVDASTNQVSLGTPERVENTYTPIAKSLSALKALLDPAPVKASEPLEKPADAATKAAELFTEESDVDEILAAIKAINEQNAALAARIDGIDTAVKTANDNEAAVKTAGVAVPAIITRPTADSDAEAEFKSFLRGMPVKAAMNEGTNSQGGYAVPAQYSNDLVKPLTDLSYLRLAGARIIKLQGTDAFHVPALTYASAASLTSEAGSYSETEPTLAEILFQPWKVTRLAKVSEELAADSRFDLWGQILNPDFAQSFAAAENTYFTTGTGSSQPAGVVTGATNLLTEATGNTTSITADGVINTFFQLDYKYRANAVWMMNDATLQLVRKLKDSQNRYLFELNPFAGGNPLQTAQGPNGIATSGYLLGKPVITNNSMATATANAVTMLFGDFSYYWVADWAGLEMQRLSELYAANGQVGFRAFRRFDAHLMLAAAIAGHKQSAT